MAAPDDDGDYLPEPPDGFHDLPVIPDENTELVTTIRGHYVEIMVIKGAERWNMLVDELNLAKLIYQLQTDLKEISSKAL